MPMKIVNTGSKCPVGTRRMVTAALKANHKAQTHFQAAFVTSKPASLPHPSAHQWRVGGSPTSLLTSRTLFNQPFGDEPSPLHRQPETQTQPIQTNKRQPENTISRFQAAFFLEPVFTIFIGRFDDIKAWIQGKKRSKGTPCEHF